MNTRRLEEGSELVGSIHWSAIATGAVIALALQALLLLFGAAIVTSIGDGAAEGGFQLWAVLVQLSSIAVGAALTARIAHAERRIGGIAAGIMVWAVTLVLGGLLQRFVMMRDDSSIWAAFFGALISLGAAILGGAFGATLGHTRDDRFIDRPIVGTR